MIIINDFLTKLTFFNTYCFKDPLVFPLTLKKIMQKENFYLDKNIDFFYKNSYNKYLKFIKLKNNLEKDKIQKRFLSAVEVTAFISSTFAFGSRIVIIKFLNQLFKTFSPFDIISLDSNSDSLIYSVNKGEIPYYRWISKKIVFLLIISLNEFYKYHDSIFDFCLKDITKNLDIEKGNRFILLKSMIKFSNFLFNTIVKKSNKFADYKLSENELTIIKNLLPQDIKSTSAKRFNLFLKWMIRDSFPDLGLWNTFSPNEKNYLPKSIFRQDYLFFPLDVHIINITTILFKFCLEDFFFTFLEKDYLENFNGIFSEDFKVLKKRLNQFLIEEKYDDFIYTIESRYDDANLKKISEDKIFSYQNNKIRYIIFYIMFEKIINIDLMVINNIKNKDEKEIFLKFYNYLKLHCPFFFKAFNRKSIFENKASHLEIVTDFYKIFNEDDPLIFDLPLSIIKSPILKDKHGKERKKR